MKKVFLGILFYSVVIMPGNQLYASVNVNFAEYCPLQAGYSWTLVDEFGTTYIYQVVGTESIDGRNKLIHSARFLLPALTRQASL